jgi:hypothetical protein
MKCVLQHEPPAPGFATRYDKANPIKFTTKDMYERYIANPKSFAPAPPKVIEKQSPTDLMQPGVRKQNSPENKVAKKHERSESHPQLKLDSISKVSPQSPGPDRKKTATPKSKKKNKKGGSKQEDYSLLGKQEILSLLELHGSCWFIAVDVEWWEQDHSTILEVGWAISHSSDASAFPFQSDLPFPIYPQQRTLRWPRDERVCARHVVIQDTDNLRNHLYTGDQKDEFLYGSTHILKNSEVASCFSDELLKLFETKMPAILVGHDIKGDVVRKYFYERFFPSKLYLHRLML